MYSLRAPHVVFNPLASNGQLAQNRLRSPFILSSVALTLRSESLLLLMSSFKCAISFCLVDNSEFNFAISASRSVMNFAISSSCCASVSFLRVSARSRSSLFSDSSLDISSSWPKPSDLVKSSNSAVTISVLFCIDTVNCSSFSFTIFLCAETIFGGAKTRYQAATVHSTRTRAPKHFVFIPIMEIIGIFFLYLSDVTDEKFSKSMIIPLLSLAAMPFFLLREDIFLQNWRGTV
mmetsp:Transcript_37561/g.55308  ORF Transcript_37561/g.55308 Transcript_37561/m.55308 type:complete len:234 (-) Transcript_37561:25-726(-)